jgi:hypothetical protein
MLKESGNCVLVRFDDGEGPQKGKFAITRCDETIGELVHPCADFTSGSSFLRVFAFPFREVMDVYYV